MVAERTTGQHERERFLLNSVPLDETRAIWQWLLSHETMYPEDTFIPALRSPAREDKPRRIVTCLLAGEWDGEYRIPTALYVYDGSRVHIEYLHGLAKDDMADALAGALFKKSYRGALLVFADGAEDEFHTLLRFIAVPLTALGFTIQPLAAKASLKALIIRKDRHTWYLADAVTMIGTRPPTTLEPTYSDVVGDELGRSHVRLLFERMHGWQRLSLRLFDTALQPSLPRAALRAASRHIRHDRWKWRPPPIAVALYRQAHGYRGGYIFARRYVGPAWRLDINKAYTWALAQPLPLRMALGPCNVRGRERAGVYLCELYGPGIMPIYISPWEGYEVGFEHAYWNGDHCYAVLASEEIEGIRALGFRVHPGYGLVTTRTWDLSAYVRQIANLLRRYPRGSSEEKLAKLFGVSVYGKMAEAPERDEVLYAAGRPSVEHHPFLTPDGTEVPYLWQRRTIAHRSYQHVDVAGAITARVRGRLYGAMSQVQAAGLTVIHADTDGLLVDGDPASLFDDDSTTIGAWRVAEHSADAAVIGRKAYSYGREVRIAGVSGVAASLVEMAARGIEVQVPGTVTAPPWSEEPHRRPQTRTVRATA